MLVKLRVNATPVCAEASSGSLHGPAQLSWRIILFLTKMESTWEVGFLSNPCKMEPDSLLHLELIGDYETGPGEGVKSR